MVRKIRRLFDPLERTWFPPKKPNPEELWAHNHLSTFMEDADARLLVKQAVLMDEGYSEAATRFFLQIGAKRYQSVVQMFDHMVSHNSQVELRALVDTAHYDSTKMMDSAILGFGPPKKPEDQPDITSHEWAELQAQIEAQNLIKFETTPTDESKRPVKEGTKPKRLEPKRFDDEYIVDDTEPQPLFRNLSNSLKNFKEGAFLAHFEGSQFWPSFFELLVKGEVPDDWPTLHRPTRADFKEDSEFKNASARHNHHQALRAIASQLYNWKVLEPDEFGKWKNRYLELRPQFEMFYQSKLLRE